MSSTERQVDHYHVIYIWKIIQGLVPNCWFSWGPSGWRGLLVAIPLRELYGNSNIKGEELRN